MQFIEKERHNWKKDYEKKEDIVTEISKPTTDYNKFFIQKRPDSGDNFKTLLSKTLKESSGTLSLINRAIHKSEFPNKKLSVMLKKKFTNKI